MHGKWKNLPRNVIINSSVAEVKVILKFYQKFKRIWFRLRYCDYYWIASWKKFYETDLILCILCTCKLAFSSFKTRGNKRISWEDPSDWFLLVAYIGSHIHELPSLFLPPLLYSVSLWWKVAASSLVSGSRVGKCASPWE